MPLDQSGIIHNYRIGKMYRIGTDSPIRLSPSDQYNPTPPPSNNFFLLLDNTPFLLLDNENLTLL